MVRCVTTPAGPTGNPNEVSPFGKFFQGDDLTVEMGELVAKNDKGASDVFMRITGTDALRDGINGKVIKYSARRAGVGGTGLDIFTMMNGQPYVRMTLRNGSWEVYLNSKDLHVSVDAEKSKAVDTKKLSAEVTQ